MTGHTAQGRGGAGHAGGALRFLALEITQTCNLHCTHCYAGSSPFTRNPEIVDWFDLMEQAHALGCHTLQFIGGEPTVHPGLGAMVERAAALGFSFIEVYSNLVRVPQGMLDLFARTGVQVATSFYSRDPDIHDAITRSPGSFHRTVQGIGAVLDHGIPLRIGMTAMEGNRVEIDRAIELLVGLGVDPDQIGVDEERAVGRGGAAEEELDALCGHCWRGKLAVSWDGSCFPCVFARRSIVGNVTRDPLGVVVASAALAGFRQRSFCHSLTRRDPVAEPA